MKHLLKYTIVVLVGILLFLTSCEGPKGEDGLVYYDVKFYTISRWTLSSDRRYYYADVASPALTSYVYENGVAMGYLMSNYNTANEVQIPLPFDIYHVNNTGVSWTETLSFDMVPGGIRFYFEPSDFVTETTPPVYTFRIVLMW